MTKKLGIDSGEYHILQNAAKVAPKGLGVELGLREGGGSQFMIESYSIPRTHIAIDPYGSLPYEWQENQIASWTYNNNMRNVAVADLYEQTRQTRTNFIFFNLTDEEFFKRFSDGVPIFQDGKTVLENEYAIVHFDAVHTLKATMTATVFFESRTVPGTIFVYDDIKGFYDHQTIEDYLLSQGWKILEKGNIKAAYQRN